ncbi:MAG: alpha/beta hydrolase [Christensenellales bacterium]
MKEAFLNGKEIIRNKPSIAGYTVFRCRVDNQIMSCYKKGAGDITFLFSSGWSVPFPLADMFEIADKLSESYKCIVFDRFGYGLSDFAYNKREISSVTEETKKLCDAFGIYKNVVFIGHSLAAFHALNFAAKYTQICKGAVIIDCYPAQTCFERMTFLIHWLPLFFFRLISNIKLLRKIGECIYKKLFLSGRNVPDEIEEAALSVIDNAMFNRVMKSELKSFNDDIKKLFSGLNIPDSVKITSVCRNATYRVNKKFTRKIPHMRIVNTGISSHLVHHKFPEAIVSEALKIADGIR